MPKIEFIRGDKYWCNCIYWTTKKGQHFIFFELFSIRHMFLKWD